MKRGLLAIGFLLVLAAVLPLSSSARSAGGTTITVNTLGDTMSVDGLCTLREAIDNANANKKNNADCAAGKGEDKIVFSVGGTINLTGELPAVQDLLTIDGDDNITINGGDSFRIVTVTAKNATLMDMVLTHGAASDGGAILSLGKTLRVDGLELSFNQASSLGGAIAGESSTLDVRNSNFHDNLAGGGGAILAFGSLTVQDTHFNENGAEEGGAILAFSLRMERSEVVANTAGLIGGIGAFFNASITDTLIQHNTGAYPPVVVGSFFVAPIHGHAPVTPKFIPHPPIPEFGKATFTRDFIVGNEGSCFGGGIGTAFVQLTILESTIAENLVTDDLCGDGFGGGVAAEFTFGTIANSTISSNTAVTDGGGIAFGEAFPVNVINSTIVDNQVDGATGAGGIALGGGQVNLTNTIVSGNDGGGDDSDCGLLVSAPTPAEGFVSGGNNIDGDDTCNLTMPKDMPNTDPDLLPLFDWGGPTPTMPPDDGSPAVDAGGTPACKAGPVSKHDQRGVARPQGTQCDIGAVERVGDEEL